MREFRKMMAGACSPSLLLILLTGAVALSFVASQEIGTTTSATTTTTSRSLGDRLRETTTQSSEKIQTTTTATTTTTMTSTTANKAAEETTTPSSQTVTTTSSYAMSPETTSSAHDATPTATATSETPEPEPVTRIIEDTMGEPRWTVKPESASSSGPNGDDNDQSEPSPSGDVGLLAKSISNAHSEGENSATNKDQGSDDQAESAELTDGGEQPSAASNNDDAMDNRGDATKPREGTPRHLNMSQIDQVFVHGVKNEQESVENWHRMGKKLKKSIGGIIGSIVPYALNMSQEAKISSNCSGAMLKWVLSMNQLKAWALRMLDASGKPIAGLLEGSMTMFGNYRQCLKVRAPDDDEIEFAGEFREYFRGKYCVIQAKPWLPEKERFYNLNTKLKSLMEEDEGNEWYDRTIFEELNEWLLAFNFVSIRYDLCVPSLCSREDIQKVVNYMLGNIDLKARVLRCETDQPNDGRHLNVAAQVESGASEVADALLAARAMDNGPDGTSEQQSAGIFSSKAFSQLAWILIPVLATSIVLIATALSLTIGEDTTVLTNDDSSTNDNSNINNSNSNSKRNKLKRTIRSLSLKRSVNSHLNVDYQQLADDKPLALYGLRFMLVLWVILVESAVNLKFEYLRELMMLKDLIFWWPMQFVINSTMQYDSFILLTAFTMAYKNCLNDGINNVKAITRYVLDKYVRLMPSIMFMVALVILMPLAYRGPVWNDYVTKQSAVCQSNGWVNVVFLQNYLPYD
uniref:Nose resistant-to-fluoxetine protein N-terminal domain-containing protein n=1 Tax=Aceria tosichella TaxID=561515 RepID=A0A6G1S6Z5_9ACAR